jgi:hypothetical protein
MAAALLTGPVGSDAEVLYLGVESEAVWTDNVFGSFVDEVDDTSGRVAPWADVRDREGRVTWSLRYEPAYEYYVDQSDLRGFDHDVSGDVTFEFTKRTKLRISDRFARYRSLSRFNEQADFGDEVNVVGFRQRFKRNRVSATLSHRVTETDDLSLDFTYLLFRFSNQNNADRDTLRTSLRYTRRMSERATFGGSAAWTRQQFERPGFDERSTDFYNLAGFFAYRLTSTLQFDISAGPAFIRSQSQSFALNDAAPALPGTQVVINKFPLVRQENGSFRMVDADSCPTNDQGERVLAVECDTVPPDISSGFVDTFSQFNTSLVNVEGDLTTPSDSRLTYFAALGLTKEWESWKGSLTYTRSFSDSTSAAAVADIVLGRLIWNPARRWRVELSGSWERQQQATDSSVLATVVANGTPISSPFLPPVAAETQAVRVQNVDSDAAIDYYRLFFRLSYQLNRRSSLFMLMNWREESLDIDAATRPDAERFTVGVGVNYHFDPIPF